MEEVLGIIGFGEVGYSFAKGLKQSGLQDILAYDKYWNQPPYSELIQKRAREAGINLVTEIKELVEKSGIIIAAVATSVAKEVAIEVAKWLAEGQIYIDVSSSSPALKKELNNIILTTGSKFVDVAIVGPIPLFGHKVPMLACGTGAEIFKENFSKYGMDITVIGKTPGQAAIIKMLRGVLTKGMQALFLEMLHATHKYGIDEQMLNSIADTFSKETFIQTANRFVTTVSIHAARRADEMDEVIRTLKEIGIEPIMTEATKKRLEWCANLGLKEYFQGKTPASYKEVLNAIQLKTEGI
ncbi:Dehydrogenase, multihelical [Moorella glycerini]|uniref:Tartronate semialdehyde reductase n=1 Tax=Neomoorella stamsii TaxID=1266720 RepID=A0A9X7J5J2_9FIRM|nr:MULTISPECIES: DUF1932 domain-containing protein [Moorella]PRR76414.1 tartronate semialdehyde reductase [Moorella stamsii]CEP67017.1 Dehydrogenase, multihelical [Moorella glycerini]